MRKNRVPKAYAGAAEAAPKGVVGGQTVADVEADEAVVFIIGMRINRFRRVRSWWPVFTGMPKMLKELEGTDAGLLGAHLAFLNPREFVTIQYWRSAEELGAYARNSAMLHAPAWGAFNKRAATGDVGIFHETYVVPRDRIESLYGNMKPFGLGAAHGAINRGERTTFTDAHRKLDSTEPEYDVATAS